MLERIPLRVLFVALPVLLVLSMAALLIALVGRPLRAQLHAQAENHVIERAARVVELVTAGDATTLAAVHARALGAAAAERGLALHWQPAPAPPTGDDSPAFDAATLAAVGPHASLVRDLAGDEHFAAAGTVNGAALALPARVVVTQQAASALAPALRLQRLVLALAGILALAGGLLGLLAWQRIARVGVPAAAPQANGGGTVAQLERVIDNLPIGISILDREFRIEYVNAAFTRLLGWTSAAARGQPSGDLLLDPPVAAEMARLQTRILRTPSEVAARFEVRTADARRVPVQAHLAPLTDARGRCDGAILMVQDQSAEARARQQADELSDRLRLFADAAVDYALVLLDADGRMLTWSRGARAVTGLDRSLALGRHVEVLFEAGDRERGLPRSLLGRALAEGQAEVEGWQLRADGGRFWSRTSLYRLPSGGDAARLALIARDMTLAHEAAQRVADSQAELAALTRRLLAQEKDTTQRLAQVLHDELGQTLAGMRLVYDAGRVNGGGGDLPRKLAEWLDRLIAEANQQVRQVLVELRPPLLDEQGLVAALSDELRQRQELRPELPLQLDVPPALHARRWPADVEYATFMVAREALNNALRHARAGRIEVCVDGDAGRLTVRVRDDGCGIPDRGTAVRPGHLGMVGMRERALAIGARLRIESLVDTGTTVELDWGDRDGAPVPDR